MVREEKRLEGAANIEDFAIWIDQEANPPEAGDLWQRSIWLLRVHGTILFLDLIRHQDKYPSIPAKPTSANNSFLPDGIGLFPSFNISDCCIQATDVNAFKASWGGLLRKAARGLCRKFCL